MGTRSRLGLLAGIVLAGLLLGPLLGPGFVLVRDMVFVPRMPIGRGLLGLEGVPRAVPSDLLVAALSRVVAAGWLQDAVLVAIVVGGACGAARLTPTTSRVGAVAAATAYGWSPYLHERLLLGQWALLVGWAVLPWAAHAALAWRRGAPGWPAVGCLAVAATGGASAVLLVGLVVAVCGRPVRAAAATVALSLPWLVPAVLQPVGAGDPAGVTAFAARSDMPLGVVGSLLTGGGIWAPAAVPPGRAVGALVAVLLLVVATIGLRPLVRRIGRPLLVAAGLGLGLALLGRTPGAQDLLRWSVTHLPGAGLLRDGQKWVAPVVLLTSAAMGCGAETVLTGLKGAAGRRGAAVLLALAPLAALPGAAWGEGGRLRTSVYPAAWEQITGQTHGDVLVLPWGLYRAFPWTGDRTVLDPATKLLARPVVDDDLPLVAGVVRGEDPLAAGLRGAVRTGAPLLVDLRRTGITQVLVERTTRGASEAALAVQTRGLVLRALTPELALYDVPTARPRPTGAGSWPVLPGDLLALGYAGLAAVQVVRQRRDR